MTGAGAAVAAVGFGLVTGAAVVAPACTTSNGALPEALEAGAAVGRAAPGLLAGAGEPGWAMAGINVMNSAAPAQLNRFKNLAMVKDAKDRMRGLTKAGNRPARRATCLLFICLGFGGLRPNNRP